MNKLFMNFHKIHVYKKTNKNICELIFLNYKEMKSLGFKI